MLALKLDLLCAYITLHTPENILSIFITKGLLFHAIFTWLSTNYWERIVFLLVIVKVGFLTKESANIDCEDKAWQETRQTDLQQKKVKVKFWMTKKVVSVQCIQNMFLS